METGQRLERVRRWARPGRAVLAASVFLGGLSSAAPARADIVFGVNAGYFALQGVDSRSSSDVLVENLRFLLFDPDEFNGFTFSGEFMLGLGDYLEVGVGAGYYQQTAFSIYADFVNSNGAEIEQDLKLRIMPVTFTARFYPATREAPVQPYIGGGLAILAWRYSESGEFVDFSNGDQVFRDTFVDEGNEPAPVVFAGMRVPLGEHFLLGGEFRWQGGSARLDDSLGFAGERIDLGGYTGQVVFQVRFK